MRRFAFVLTFVMFCFTETWLVAESKSNEAGGRAKKAVTFNKDIAPIFFGKCTECHRPGEAAPMSLLTYKDARPWARSISGRREPRGSRPPTPPYVRFRIRRFTK